jgi:toxin ParE1/3/4
MPSSPNPGNYVLKLSAEAEDDIRDILQYTYETWGEHQVQVYQAVLNKALSTLLSNPSIGHKRSDLSPDSRVLRAGQHFIVYWVSGTIIYVVRILHERMDFGRHT